MAVWSNCLSKLSVSDVGSLVTSVSAVRILVPPRLVLIQRHQHQHRQRPRITCLFTFRVSQVPSTYHTSIMCVCARMCMMGHVCGSTLRQAVRGDTDHTDSFVSPAVTGGVDARTFASFFGEFTGSATKVGHGLVHTSAQSGVTGLAQLRRWVSVLMNHFQLQPVFRPLPPNSTACGVGRQAKMLALCIMPQAIAGIPGLLEWVIMEAPPSRGAPRVDSQQLFLGCRCCH